MGMFQHVRQRKEWIVFAVLPKADGRLAFVWWAVVLLRGVLPAVFAIAMASWWLQYRVGTAWLVHWQRSAASSSCCRC